jgi:hypothetical protein
LAFADAEFGQNACEGARQNAKKHNLKSSTTRAIRHRRLTSPRSCARCRRPIPICSSSALTASTPSVW